MGAPSPQGKVDQCCKNEQRRGGGLGHKREWLDSAKVGVRNRTSGRRTEVWNEKVITGLASSKFAVEHLGCYSALVRTSSGFPNSDAEGSRGPCRNSRNFNGVRRASWKETCGSEWGSGDRREGVSLDQE